MNKKIIIIPIVFVITILGMTFSLDSSEEENNDEVFHVTLADPDLYKNGVYTSIFTVEKGEYSFRFVPNGSSPKILSITLNGEGFDFYEDFMLEGTSHQTGISEYFTWEYNGEKIIFVPETQEISIVIDPNGTVMGSVSVDILEN